MRHYLLPPLSRLEPLARAALDQLPDATRAHARASLTEAAAAARSLADAASDAGEEWIDRIGAALGPRPKR